MSKAWSRIGLMYAAFAGLATLANLVAQWSVFRLYDGAHSLPLGMAAGTLVGLMVKYVLDKRWIFEDYETGASRHARKFSLYSLTGVFTTALFWATELVSAHVGQREIWRYVGAVVGLGIGYSIKYCLDRRFVFARTA
ncbi:MAG: GtrA family protein [Hyphomicrobium sp.]